MKKILLIAIILIMPIADAMANYARIKDVVAIEGVRKNILLGYGLVVGLNGTGDNLNNITFTEKGLTDMLEKLGVNVRGSNLKTKNVAAVTVTAYLPTFARVGSNIDISVNTLGDAKSIQGGTLLATPLVGADGQVYAVAQGPVSVGGFSAKGGSGGSISKGVPTSGLIPGGAIVENEVQFDFNSLEKIRLALKNPDIATSKKIAEIINRRIDGNIATALDPGTVELVVPKSYKGNNMALLSTIEQLEIDVDQPAKIVIDEASGTIVIGENVRINTIAIAQGNLIIKIDETAAVSQPGAFAPDGAETVTTQNSDIKVDEQSGNKLAVLRENATLGELVRGLNNLGVGPRDMITILQTIKSQGALQADIEVR